ncbi:MAG: hypothetical protein CR992_00110 [Desulfobacterales bacterium]|nr:MAG: hypothetical protein CR992_00110 [Desulfobacterales bacterium]
MTTPSKIITKQIESFPALPSTVANVLAVSADPDSTAADLVDAILPDQTMCSAILKVANSAFYGIPKEVATIERAVIVLGYEEIRNIVIGKAIFSAFPKVDKDQKENISLFWEQSFACGLCANIIGKHFDKKSSELFIAGLIHDIGKLSILLSFPNNYPIVNTLSGLTSSNTTEKERKQFTASHDEVGLKLTRHWMFPEQLVAAVGYHHRPEEAPAFTEYPLIVQLADIISTLYCSPEAKSAAEITEFFSGYLPEITLLWDRYNMGLKLENIREWFEILQQRRESEQGLLDILTSR